VLFGLAFFAELGLALMDACCADFLVATLDLCCFAFLDAFALCLLLCLLPCFVLAAADVCDWVVTGELTLWLALCTIGGAAAASSKGKGASSAKTTPAQAKAPIRINIFRSTSFPLFQFAWRTFSRLRSGAL
jgi:hypothetical protein